MKTKEFELRIGYRSVGSGTQDFNCKTQKPIYIINAGPQITHLNIHEKCVANLKIFTSIKHFQCDNIDRLSFVMNFSVHCHGVVSRVTAFQAGGPGSIPGSTGI